MTSTEYYAPSYASRLKAAAFLAAVVAWGTTHHLWFSPLVEKIDSCAACSSLWAIRLVAAYIVALPLAISLLLAYSAHQILRTGQNPPPNSWLLFKVRLHRGVRAKLAAYTFGTAAFVLALVPGIIAYQFGFSYIFCIVEDCGCNEPATYKQLPNACHPKPVPNEA